MAALFTLLLSASAAILGHSLYDFSKQNFIRETQAAIDAEISSILAAGDGDTRKYIARIAAQRDHPFYLYMDTAENKLEGNIDALPSSVERITEGLIRFTLDIKGEHRNVAAKIHTFANGERLMVARDIEEITASYHRLQWFSALIMTFMLIVVLVSFVISTFVVSRINTIAATAKKIIDTGDVSARISIDTEWDDLSNLAQVLNELLTTIETSIHNTREVGDNIAHDLRTPLTRLRNKLEALKSETSQPTKVEELLAEADHLLATFNSLLRIANIEKGQRHQQFELFNIGQLLLDVIELYEPLAEERRIAIIRTLPEGLYLNGDKDLLFQLFANVLDNAIKFTPDHTAVEVVLSQEQKTQVTIADQGVGVSENDKEHVFRRFYRGDTSRNTKGNGLGLSLVKAILDVHKGGIALEDNHPGLRVRLTL